jgi:hypothetical protein
LPNSAATVNFSYFVSKMKPTLGFQLFLFLIPFLKAHLQARPLQH